MDIHQGHKLHNKVVPQRRPLVLNLPLDPKSGIEYAAITTKKVYLPST
jgi:hypothetical protein